MLKILQLNALHFIFFVCISLLSVFVLVNTLTNFMYKDQALYEAQNATPYSLVSSNN